MRRFIEIDDKTKAGKAVLEMVTELHKVTKSVKILPSKEEMQKAYEKAFVQKMKEAEKEGLADKDEVEKLLGRV